MQHVGEMATTGGQGIFLHSSYTVTHERVCNRRDTGNEEDAPMSLEGAMIRCPVGAREVGPKLEEQMTFLMCTLG